MSHAMDSKSAAAMLDPFNQPEPAAEDGPGGSGFGSTFAPASQINGASSSTATSNNPYRSSSMTKTPSPKYSKPAPSKSGASTSVRASSGGSPRPERFPDYRAEAFNNFDSGPRRNRAESHGTPPTYQEATSPRSSSAANGRPRRGSSLKERYPGDKSNQPLDIIRRDSKKAYKSHHLHKRSIPGADSIDRLDPAIGGRSYHHEGPYDAALMARNRDQKTGPLYALEGSNSEALKATPRENIKEAVERHRPLDGTAIVPPGVPDRFGRKYDYEEGADLMHEPGSDAGYKRWPGQSYSPEDLKGQSSPTFDLDRALKAHRIDETSQGGIELQDRSRISREYHDAERTGQLDTRDPVEIAGDDGKYADLEIANIRKSAEMNSGADAGMSRGGVRSSLKKRIGSLKNKNREDS